MAALCAVPAEFLRRILDLLSTFFTYRLFYERKLLKAGRADQTARRLYDSPHTGQCAGKKNIQNCFFIHGFLYISVCPGSDPSGLGLNSGSDPAGLAPPGSDLHLNSRLNFQDPVLQSEYRFCSISFSTINWQHFRQSHQAHTFFRPGHGCIDQIPGHQHPRPRINGDHHRRIFTSLGFMYGDGICQLQLLQLVKARTPPSAPR